MISGLPLAVLIGARSAMVCAVGLIFPTANALAMADYPDLAGTASSLQGSSQFIFGAVVAPLVGIAGDQTALPLGIVTTAVSVCAMASFVSLVIPVVQARAKNYDAANALTAPEALPPPGTSCGSSSGVPPDPKHRQSSPDSYVSRLPADRHRQTRPPEPARISFRELQLPAGLRRRLLEDAMDPSPVRCTHHSPPEAGRLHRLPLIRRPRFRWASRSHARRVRWRR